MQDLIDKQEVKWYNYRRLSTYSKQKGRICMGRHPKLEKLDYLFSTGTDFCLTSHLYEEKTGTTLPKDKSYLKDKSALATKAQEHGYVIVAVEEKPIIERTVIFKKVR